MAELYLAALKQHLRATDIGVEGEFGVLDITVLLSKHKGLLQAIRVPQVHLVLAVGGARPPEKGSLRAEGVHHGSGAKEPANHQRQGHTEAHLGPHRKVPRVED